MIDQCERVDIIVPAFNRVGWLIECLTSVLEQSYANFRLIVVDDGSTPPLSGRPELTVIWSDDRVRLIRSPHRGPAFARNLGLQVANGAFVLMLDSDDVLDRGGLAVLIGAALATGVDLVVGGWMDFEATAIQNIVQPRQSYGDAYADCVEQMWVNGAILLKNSQVPRFNEQRMPWESLEFYLDYLAPGRLAAYVDRVVVRCRQHNEPDRLTIRNNHFEPYIMGRFFVEKKDRLKQIGLASEVRITALDSRILSCVHMLLCRGRRRDAGRLFDKVDWPLRPRDRRLRVGSFSWMSQVFGFGGARAFIAANRLLGRV
jgi:glycosyltransferase involved in cell wall biosynthesis